MVKMVRGFEKVRESQGILTCCPDVKVLPLRDDLSFSRVRYQEVMEIFWGQGEISEKSGKIKVEKVSTP